MLANKLTQPHRFRARNRVEINDDLRRTYNSNSQIKFETMMLKSIYVIIVMRTYLLEELLPSQTLQPQVQ